MYFWKIDEESIYCLINASEIRDMGYDIKELSSSHDLMGKFLDEIVKNSFKYIKWNTDNGIQTYIARARPAGQFLLTISCTFIDVAIDRDLDQIRSMTEAMNQKITRERIDKIYGMEGEEKERAFEALARDLHAICSGEEAEIREGDSFDADQAEEYQREASWERDLPRPEKTRKDRKQVYLFRYPSFRSLTAFCAGLGRKFILPSVLYRSGEDYVLEVTFPGGMRKDEVLYCVMAGEEYGGQVKIDKFDSNYLKEHGTKVIGEDAIRILQTLQ